MFKNKIFKSMNLDIYIKKKIFEDQSYLKKTKLHYPFPFD